MTKTLFNADELRLKAKKADWQRFFDQCLPGYGLKNIYDLEVPLKPEKEEGKGAWELLILPKEEGCTALWVRENGVKMYKEDNTCLTPMEALTLSAFKAYDALYKKFD